MAKGLFITLEGAEGAGKTTQAGLLADWLAGLGLDVLLTREPGAGSIGGQIRAVLLAPENAALAPMTEALLLAADRAQHVAETLASALAAGKVVLCDRFADSFFAYQGYERSRHGRPLAGYHAAFGAAAGRGLKAGGGARRGRSYGAGAAGIPPAAGCRLCRSGAGGAAAYPAHRRRAGRGHRAGGYPGGAAAGAYTERVGG